jgi:hypothetical protein
MAMSARVVRLQNEGMTDSMAQNWARAVLDMTVADSGRPWVPPTWFLLWTAKEPEVRRFSPNVSHHCLND